MLASELPPPPHSRLQPTNQHSRHRSTTPGLHRWPAGHSLHSFDLDLHLDLRPFLPSHVVISVPQSPIEASSPGLTSSPTVLALVLALISAPIINLVMEEVVPNLVLDPPTTLLVALESFFGRIDDVVESLGFSLHLEILIVHFDTAYTLLYHIFLIM
ncbi:hypothetical protein KC19_VG118000 [Ceratodon purpureus]|uniref:Uncharacterized protein n=1 Tax=Ceratodon purpureus TaxID=3225 RepID=A0A8T0HPD9_CERPU|nr:hypothetical protein KC19_VG118000 [Ceratodon purpureus]